MDIIKKYGNVLKDKYEDDPDTALKMIKLGLWLENSKSRIKPVEGLPSAYRQLYSMAVKSTRETLKEPEKSLWVNIFAPVEIMQCFGLKPMSLETLSTFVSGFKTEDYFIDFAESRGIATTLCSFHKNFIGGVQCGVFPTAAHAVTTSSVCDGNINTLRYLCMRNNTGLTVIDVPHEYTENTQKYVSSQLYEFINELEVLTGKKLNMNSLSEVIHRENESHRYYKEFLNEIKTRCYPNTLTVNQAMLYATHLNIGTPEVLEFFRLLAQDVKKYPEYTGNKVLWVHLQPYYQETLREYFNCSKENNIQLYDFNLDYIDEMDELHPVEAIAKKMILNAYNGDYSRKIHFIENLIDEYDPDGVIHYCHWGCKQSSGGVMMLREAVTAKGKPMLILDGDALDRRNSPDGQIRTRLEAFLEMLGNRRGVK